MRDLDYKEAYVFGVINRFLVSEQDLEEIVREMEKKEVDKSSDEDDDENQESDGGQESNLISFRQENDSL